MTILLSSTYCDLTEFREAAAPVGLPVPSNAAKSDSTTPLEFTMPTDPWANLTPAERAQWEALDRAPLPREVIERISGRFTPPQEWLDEDNDF